MPFCFSIYNSAASAHILRLKRLKKGKLSKALVWIPTKSKERVLGLENDQITTERIPMEIWEWITVCIGFLPKIRLKLRLKPLFSVLGRYKEYGQEPKWLNSTLNKFVFIAFIVCTRAGSKMRIINIKASQSTWMFLLFWGKYPQTNTKIRPKTWKTEEIRMKGKRCSSKAVSTRGSFTQHFWHGAVGLVWTKEFL